MIYNNPPRNGRCLDVGKRDIQDMYIILVWNVEMLNMIMLSNLMVMLFAAGSTKTN